MPVATIFFSLVLLEISLLISFNSDIGILKELIPSFHLKFGTAEFSKSIKVFTKSELCPKISKITLEVHC